MAQIDNNAIHIHLNQFSNKSFNVFGGTFIVFVSGSLGFIVRIKCGDVNNPKGHPPALMVNLDGIALCGLVFKLDFIPHQCNGVCRRTNGFPRPQKLQPDQGSLFSTNKLNHIIDPPSHNVDDFTVFPLTNSQNSIIRMQLIAFGCGTARNNFNHFGIFVFGGQPCANAFQRLAHMNSKIVKSFRRKIIGMGVKRFRQRIHQ